MYQLVDGLMNRDRRASCTFLSKHLGASIVNALPSIIYLFGVGSAVLGRLNVSVSFCQHGCGGGHVGAVFGIEAGNPFKPRAEVSADQSRCFSKAFRLLGKGDEVTSVVEEDAEQPIFGFGPRQSHGSAPAIVLASSFFERVLHASDEFTISVRKHDVARSAVWMCLWEQLLGKFEALTASGVGRQRGHGECGSYGEQDPHGLSIGCVPAQIQCERHVTM